MCVCVCSAEQLQLSEAGLGERTLRREARAGGNVALPELALPDRRKRRQLTAEELEDRKKKVCVHTRTHE